MQVAGIAQLKRCAVDSTYVILGSLKLTKADNFFQRRKSDTNSILLNQCLARQIARICPVQGSAFTSYSTVSKQ